MNNKDILITNENERSTTIGLIHLINNYVEKYDFIIKCAGGEMTIKSHKKIMFPDVILYGDINHRIILQGWEIKMPDVPITDNLFYNDAERKARALRLNSFVMWNFKTVVLYVYNSKCDHFEEGKRWTHDKINERQDVERYKNEWVKTLEDVIKNVNYLLKSNNVGGTRMTDVVSELALSSLIVLNKESVAYYLKEKCNSNSYMGAWINRWWETSKIEYEFDECDKFNAYSKYIITNWTCKIIFSHLIKSFHEYAFAVDKISYETTPHQANIIFEEISKHCDFYNVFDELKYNSEIPTLSWHNLVEFSIFLKDNLISHIDQSTLQNIMEKCVDVSRRVLHGQYTTPVVLSRILAQITVHNWNTDCIDPCCGTGTIAKEILNEKKKRVSVQSAMRTTWACDKYSLPLQIANISLTTPETINTPTLLFKENALNLKEGRNIKFVNPANGLVISFSLPKMGAICSNLPFVHFENIDDEDKMFIENNTNGRYDLYQYIVLALDKIIDNNGYIGVITSNSWLCSSAGKEFYKDISKLYDIKQIHISGAGRWFINADVVATIILLQKLNQESNKNKHISFYVWKKTLDEISINENYVDTIINDSILDEVSDHEILDCHKYDIEQIDNFLNLNMSFNAMFHDISWLFNFREVLVPLNSKFKVFRGSRRGWDKLFFPKKGHPIDKTFIRPALFNGRNVTNLIAEPDREAFCCNEKPDFLKQNYRGTYSWIMRFINEKNEEGRPLPVVLAKKKCLWYEMSPNEMALFFTIMNPDKRLYFGLFKEPTFINQRLIGLIPKGEIDLELCHALLNSILMKFFIEAIGFGRGLGVLDINKDNVEKCYILNPDLLDSKMKMRIIKLFSKIKEKNIISVEEELNDNDWISFNHCLLEAYNLDMYYDMICNTLLSLRKTRQAVND